MYKKYVKRLIDIILSSITILILSPIYLIISLLILIFDRGNIIYSQLRTGKDGKNFKIYKFRTMKNGEVTKLGKFLRMTSLDELPQFFNVLKGDMSIVGPRPWIPDYYQRFNDKQKQRNIIRPGLVGLAQVNGRRQIDVFEKIDFDLKYIEKTSLWMDFKIIFKSLKVIISKQDAISTDQYIKNELKKLEQQ